MDECISMDVVKKWVVKEYEPVKFAVVEDMPGAPLSLAMDSETEDRECYYDDKKEEQEEQLLIFPPACKKQRYDQIGIG